MCREFQGYKGVVVLEGESEKERCFSFALFVGLVFFSSLFFFFSISIQVILFLFFLFFLSFRFFTWRLGFFDFSIESTDPQLFYLSMYVSSTIVQSKLCFMQEQDMNMNHKCS